MVGTSNLGSWNGHWCLVRDFSSEAGWMTIAFDFLTFGVCQKKGLSHVGFLSTTTSLWKHGFFSVNLTTKTINKSRHLLQKVIETLLYLAPKGAPPAQPWAMPWPPHSAPWSSAQSIASRCLPGQRHAPRRCRWGTWNAAAMGLGVRLVDSGHATSSQLFCENRQIFNRYL